ncbi:MULTISPECIES: rod-binding protein [Sphingobium]|uniref:Flagellar P-ring protein FlgI n=1 Tax=Sphingobium chungbukense TaxID=56193 RepID=A0A0M3AUI4_9SPHN|nr:MULTISPECIES: rod-binding protein [Sphingobium]KKW93500.1 flagellar P-ring protein FlgI [Sphingobium chungbukense]PJG47977.1 flagellar biosynthesis protein FlgI [Sphingobium sp. LB126]
MQIGATSGTAAQAGGTQNKASLEKAAQQFEAIFLRQMMGAMRSASLAEGISDSSATDQFRDMADARTADSMASRGTLGIAEMLMHQFGAKVAIPAAAPAGDKAE